MREKVFRNSRGFRCNVSFVDFTSVFVNLKYIGETKRRLKDRFNEHRRAVDKTRGTPTIL